MTKNKIAMLGTFDVNNYGDLLFPYIAEHRLQNYSLEFVSPTSEETVFIDAKKCTSFSDFRRMKWHGVLIGGGNILHLRKNTVTVYRHEGFSYADLWVGAVNFAAKSNIPSVFNAPGISMLFSTEQAREIAKRTFESSNYIALRDEHSRSLLKDIVSVEKKIKVVPDTALEICKVWPFEAGHKDEVISVNVNQRYHSDIRETAKWLDKIAGKEKLLIKFIVIGGCHGDLVFTQKVAKKIKSAYVIDDSNSLKGIAHSIANSRLFLGSSMHAFVTAISYGVPAFLVLNQNPMHKFAGLLDLCGLSLDVQCSSFEQSYHSLGREALLSDRGWLKIKTDLDSHWNDVEKIFDSGMPTVRDPYLDNYIEILTEMNKEDKKTKILNALSEIKRSNTFRKIKRTIRSVLPE